VNFFRPIIERGSFPWILLLQNEKCVLSSDLSDFKKSLLKRGKIVPLGRTDRVARKLSAGAFNLPRSFPKSLGPDICVQPLLFIPSTATPWRSAVTLLFPSSFSVDNSARGTRSPGSGPVACF